MAYVPPWVQGANALEAISRGMSAGNQLRSIREQANDSLRRHAAAMAALSLRAQENRQQAEAQRAAITAREHLAQSQLDLQGKKLDQAAEEEQNRVRLASRALDLKGKADPYSFYNTSGGLVKANRQTGEVTPVEGTQRKSALEFLSGGGAPPPGGGSPPPGGGAVTPINTLGRNLTPGIWNRVAGRVAAPQEQGAAVGAPAAIPPGGIQNANLLGSAVAPTTRPVSALLQEQPPTNTVNPKDPAGLFQIMQLINEQTP